MPGIFGSARKGLLSLTLLLLGGVAVFVVYLLLFPLFPWKMSQHPLSLLSAAIFLVLWFQNVLFYWIYCQTDEEEK